MNLIEDIARRADPAAIALVSADREITFGELFSRAGELADALRPQLPAARRARVGLDCRDGVDYILLSMALLLAGACLVPLAEELTAAERDEVIRTTSLDFILRHGGGEDLEGSEDGGGGPALIALDPADPAFPEEGFQALNPAFIRFSSGTTGTSKGVVLSHESLLARITAANRGMQLSPADRVLWMLPMAHHFAVSIVLYLHAGATTVLEPRPLAADILATAERRGATVIYGAPFHFALLAADPGSFRWPGLRLAVATAAALPATVAEGFRRRFDQPLVQGLGIIEVGLAVLNLDDAAEHPTAIGKPLPDYELRLLDAAGDEVSDGEAGEFRIRGPGLLDAYLVPWNPSPLEDGYFASGDLVRREPSGLLRLVGRIKSVIVVAGMKVFPEEVESVLDHHPGVRRSRVHPREHPHSGQVPVAEFIPADPAAPPSSRELQAYCRERLSAYKVPLRFTAVESLPLTASGKLRRTGTTKAP